VSKPLEHLELVFGSEFPTERAPARAAAAARKAALTLDEDAEQGAEDAQRERWIDSEAPTGIAAQRPLLPRPPRSPTL
jgi:hypothetical protein